MSYRIIVTVGRATLQDATEKNRAIEASRERAVRKAKEFAREYHRSAGYAVAVYAPDGECIWETY